MSPRPHIAVLLATRNGAAYLEAQLESYVAQTLRPALILISDDGSTDETRAIADAFRASTDGIRIELHDGPQNGSAANFLHLIQQVPDDIDAVAFSDQDDVWLPHKLARAADLLPSDGVRLYCARTYHCNEALERTGTSRTISKPACFQNALVQNIAAGNTIVLNKGALDLAKRAGTPRVVVHDWWLYQLITGAGGHVIYDNDLVLLYRQHDGNVIGANEGVRSQFRRLGLMLKGGLATWNDVNIEALACVAHLLTPENRKTLEDFKAMRQSPWPKRLAELSRLGLYRQGMAGEASLWLAALLGKV